MHYQLLKSDYRLLKPQSGTQLDDFRMATRIREQCTGATKHNAFSSAGNKKRGSPVGLPLRRKLTKALRRSTRWVCFQFLPKFRFATLPLIALLASKNFGWRRNLFANPC
jgi:hypothetical protein